MRSWCGLGAGSVRAQGDLDAEKKVTPSGQTRQGTGEEA